MPTPPVSRSATPLIPPLAASNERFSPSVANTSLPLPTAYTDDHAELRKTANDVSKHYLSGFEPSEDWKDIVDGIMLIGLTSPEPGPAFRP
jgi:hypothetical protein